MGQKMEKIEMKRPVRNAHYSKSVEIERLWDRSAEDGWHWAEETQGIPIGGELGVGEGGRPQRKSAFQGRTVRSVPVLVASWVLSAGE